MASSHQEKVPPETLSPASDGLSVQTPLTQAPSGRPYLLYQPSSGKKVKMLGALLPDGYELRSDSKYPFMCPVKSCGAQFSILEGVDVHFMRHHEAEMFHDNRDGTLSFVGRRTGQGKLAAIVVSQEASKSQDTQPIVADTKADPSQEVALEKAQSKKILSLSTPTTDKPSRDGKRSTSSSRPDMTTPEENEPFVSKQMAETWEKLLSHIDDAAARHDHQHVEHHTMVENFSDLAVACYSEKLGNDKHDNAALMPAAEFTPAVPITATPSEVHAENNADHQASAVESMLVTPQRRSTRIVLKAGKEAPMPTVTPTVPSGPRTRLQSGSTPKTPKVGESTPTARRSSRIKIVSTPSTSKAELPPTPTTSSAKKRKLQSQKSEKKGATASSSGSNNGGSISSKRRFSRRDIHLGPQASSSSNSSVPSQIVSPTPSPRLPSIFGFQDVFQLENWEMAPGNIRSGGQIIAFSTTYLRSNNPINIHRGMAFHVVIVSAGMSHRVEASSDKIRLVSVTAGKINVKFSGEENFVISSNGIIKVRADVACILQNPFGIDATLQVFAMQQEQS